MWRREQLLLGECVRWSTTSSVVVVLETKHLNWVGCFPDDDDDDDTDFVCHILAFSPHP